MTATPAGGARGGALGVLLWAWPLGSAWLLARLLLAVARRQRLLRTAEPFEGELPGAAAAVPIPELEHLEVLLSDAIEIPVTWGYRRPVLLLPLGARSWDARRLGHVLLHELAHVRRADAAWIAVARSVRALYWPLPFVWWAERRLLAEGEIASDDQVVRAGAAPSSYAADLVGFARELRGHLPAPVAAMARRSDLAWRVRAVLDPQRDRSVPGRLAVAATLVISCAVVAPLVASVRIAPVAARSVAELAQEEALASARPLTSSSRSAGQTTDGQTTDDSASAAAPAAAAETAVATAAPTASVPSAIASAVRRTASGLAVATRKARSAVVATAGVMTGRSGQRRSANLSFSSDGEGEPELIPGCGPVRSTQIHQHDDRLQLELASPDCRFELDVVGEVVIADDESGVARMGPRARLVLREDLRGATRKLVVEGADGGAPRYRLEVDGRERAFGTEEREWLAARLPLVLRATGWDAEARVERILARAGVEGVFEEIRLIPTDHVSRVYLVHTLERAHLDDDQLRRWIDLAAETVGSDHELAEALSALPAAALGERRIQESFVNAAGTLGSDHELRRTLSRLLDAEPAGEVLDTILEAALTLGSDFELAELLIDVLRRYPAGRQLPATFFEAAASIGSDFELRRTLGAFLARDDLGRSADQLDAVLEAATGIGSDFEAAELLVEVAGVYPSSRDLPDAFFDLAESIGSDFELHRALDAAAARTLSPRSLERLLVVARGIGSDHELAELLRAVRRRHALDGGARAAFERAVATLSGIERRSFEESSR